MEVYVFQHMPVTGQLPTPEITNRRDRDAFQQFRVLANLT